MVASIAFFSVLMSTIGWIIPYRWLAELAKLWANINITSLGIICGLRYRLHGWEHIPASNCIIFCKHQSAWETIALRALLPAENTWVLKRELLWVPFFGWALAPLRPIAIDRSSKRQAVRQLLNEGQYWLNKGRWIVIFPEGTRVAPGERKKYGIGGALLAQKSGYPVIPIAHNAGVFWPRRKIRKFSGTIDLVVGKPIETNGLSAAQINHAIEEWIEGTVSSLPGERDASISKPKSI